jgi:pimeloyl-ACP methyl ester carboxylesterase
MVLALQSPETTAGVIPVDNSPVTARLGSPFQEYVKGMEEISAAHVTKQSEADQILSKYEPVCLSPLPTVYIRKTDHIKQSLPIRQFLLTNLVRDPESDNKALKFRVPLDILGSALQEMANFPFDPTSNDIPTYSGPTMFVRGLQSNYISDRKLPACKKFFPNAQIVGIDAGHWVISEKPEEFRQGMYTLSTPFFLDQITNMDV